jgi:hypothetical protein
MLESPARTNKYRWAVISACLLVARGSAAEVVACSVCQGNPDSDLSKGAQAGVLFMVIVTYAVLLSFAGLAALWFVRVRRIRLQGQSAAQPVLPEDAPFAT